MTGLLDLRFLSLLFYFTQSFEQGPPIRYFLALNLTSDILPTGIVHAPR